MIPDRHGTGTNGLILSPPDAIAPAFGPGSRERHLELARAAGLRCRVATIPSMALDLDTGEDLRELAAALRAEPELRPRDGRRSGGARGSGSTEHRDLAPAGRRSA